MNILKFNKDGSALAELTPTEASLIQRALTAPVKRKVKAMSLQLDILINQSQGSKEFNDKFIETFYTSKPRTKRRKK